HDTVYRHPGRAKKALEAIEKAVGPEATAVMARDNPERVLAGQELEMPGPMAEGGRKRKRWKIF
ncbi:MAG: hypothetical protein ACOCUC_00410, partial [bacterium]